MAGTKRRPGALPTVQETLLKKRKAAMEARAARTHHEAKDRQRVRKRRSGGSSFVRVERLVKLGRLKDRDSARLNRLLRRPLPLLPATAPTAAAASETADTAAPAAQAERERPLLVVRCRGRAAGMDARVTRALRLFRLTSLNTAVFVRPTPACLAALRLLDPFVAWGSPDLRSVRELVYKRGHAASAKTGRPQPITDNAMVEDGLGKHGLLCIEDLVHELASCGTAFVPAASFLCPVRLRAPLGGWAKAEARMRESGSGGRGGGGCRRPLLCSRDEYINSLLREMI